MDRYESLGVVGEGSYGVVLKCRHRDSGQIVAVKKFLESDEDQNVKKIALREVRMLKRLRHENLINLIEFFRRKRRLYLVFEFVDHTVLDELEDRESGLDPDVARTYIFQVIRGIAFCHQNQIIHRDVKPENVLVSRLGVVKLCDFGFARILEGPNETCTDYVATRWYRSPELLVGDTKYGREVDIWAIGCLLAEMLSGEPLFPGESDIDQLFHIIQTLGELDASHKQLVEKNPMLSGLRLPSAASSPLSSTFPHWHPRTLAFISECLDLTPSKRPTALGLLKHEYCTHDSFPETFLPELQKKVQQEFNSNVLLQTSGGRRGSGQNEKKSRKPAYDGPQSHSFKYSSKTHQATTRSSPKKLLAQGPTYSSSLIQQELSMASSNSGPQNQFSVNNQTPSNSQSHSTSLGQISQPLQNQYQQSLNSQLQEPQAFGQQLQPVNTARPFVTYTSIASTSTGIRGSNFPYDEGPVSLPFTQIPPIKETQSISKDTLSNIGLFQNGHSSTNLTTTPLHTNKNSYAVLNLQLLSSPGRSFRKEEKPKKSSQMQWGTTTTRNQGLSIQGQNQYQMAPSIDTTHRDGRNHPQLFDPTTTSPLTPISPYSRHHQFDSNRHPYAISLDRTKEASSRDMSRDPLREIRDNSKDGRKESLPSHLSKENARKSRKEVSGWAKPKLLNDDLYLPNVPGVGGKQSFSDTKTSKAEMAAGDSVARGGRNPKEKKTSGPLMPFLCDLDRGSASSTESFEAARPGSNLPYV